MTVRRFVFLTMATRHWTNFRPAEIFDWSLCSHGTVQCLRSVHTELTNQFEVNFFQRFSPSAYAHSNSSRSNSSIPPIASAALSRGRGR